MTQRRLPHATRILPRFVDTARRARDTPVVLCIDVEPDDRVFAASDAPPWRGFERCLERLPALRELLSEVTGAPATFAWCLRMDPQVAQTWGSPEWVVDAYGSALEELLARGDDVGLHTHTWRPDADRDSWYADFEDEAWATHCVEVALDAFERAFGTPCAVHRGGDHFLSGAMLACLEDRGVLVDLTVEPGRRGPGVMEGEAFRGRCVEYRDVPTGPYRSSPATFPRRDPSRSGGPLLMPLTTTVGRRMMRVPIPPDSDPRRFIPRIEFELLQKAKPILAFAVRTEVALGNRWDWLARNLEHLGSHKGVRFVTATAALAEMERPALLARSAP